MSQLNTDASVQNDPETEAEDAAALRADHPGAAAPWRQAFRVLGLLENDKWILGGIVALGLGAALAEGIGLSLFIPLIRALSGEDLNGVFGPFAGAMQWIPQRHMAAVIIAIIIATIIIKNIILYANEVFSQYIKGKVCHRLRATAFSQTLSSCAEYASGDRQGQIANIIAAETWRVGDALFHVLRMVVALVMSALLSVLLFLISWRLGIAALTGLAVVIMAVNLLSSYARAVGKSTVEANRQFGLRLWERIHALKLIRSFGQEARETEEFSKRSDGTRRQMFRISLMWTMPGHFAEILSAVLVAVLILLAVGYQTDFAVLLAFLAVFYRLQHPAREIVSNMVAVSSLSGSIETVLDYIDRTRTPYIKPGMDSFETLNEAIEFRNVSFRYTEDDAPALDNVSFSIPRGRMTALVGESGAGKSTLIDLLFRFHDPNEGEILVDGFPLTHLDPVQWRSRLSLMSQDVRLFDAPVIENIAYGMSHTVPEDVEKAAKVADAHAFISALPEGYDTVLGEDGVRLSGGQRQRIALARSVLRNPEILLLDEPTNALDSVSEAAFQKSLESYMEGKTVLVVAHRLSTIRHADNIVVLQRGRVAEQGTYDGLMKANGAFARLHETQFGQG